MRIEVGEYAYHPITNGYNRGDRLCCDCVEPPTMWDV